jgi:exosortase A
LPISLFLIWRKREDLARLTPCYEPLALVPLLAAALLWLVGRAGQIQLFEHVALIGMAISITLAVLGWTIGRLIAFPLLFLGFMVPFGDFLIPALQQFTATFAVLLLRMIGIPVFHDGIMIETPSGRFEVAEACAGIRFLIANVVVATLFAHLAMKKLWKWVLFLGLSVAVPIIANGFRATGIMLIAYWTDNTYAAGIDHIVYGWGFFAAVMLLFLAIGSWMADWPDEAQHADLRSIVVDVSPWRPAFALPLIALIAAAPAYAKIVLERAPDIVAVDPKSALSPKLVQHLAPACKTASDEANDWRPLFKKADFSRGLQLDCDGQPVDLFVAYYVYEREGAELVHHANRLADGDSWTRISASWYAPEIEGLPSSLRKEELTGRTADDRLVLAWYWVDGRLIARDWQVKAYQLYQKLLGKDEPSALIALSAPYSDDPSDALSGIAKVLEQHKGISDYLIDLKPKPSP